VNTGSILGGVSLNTSQLSAGETVVATDTLGMQLVINQTVYAYNTSPLSTAATVITAT